MKTKFLSILILIISISLNSKASDKKIIMGALIKEPYTGPVLANNGLIAEISTLVFKAMGHNSEIRFFERDSLIVKMKNGKIDVVIGLSQEGLETNIYNFTSKIYQANRSLYCLVDSIAEIRSLYTIRNLKVGIVNGSAIPREMLLNNVNNLIYVSDVKDNINMLLSGDVDCILVEDDMLNYFFRYEHALTKKRLKKIDLKLTGIDMHNAMLKEIEASDEIIDKFNITFNKLYDIGLIEEIIDNHLSK